MEKADFYVGDGRQADWVGSVNRCGEIWAISTPILLQVNRTMYEELVIEYINFCEGVVANHVCQWPWEWPDSSGTDYSYIFSPAHEKVYMSIQGGDLMDPIKIVQGESMTEANCFMGPPIFPTMIDQICFEEKELHGHKSTASL